jgi:hypothetical protein
MNLGAQTAQGRRAWFSSFEGKGAGTNDHGSRPPRPTPNGRPMTSARQDRIQQLLEKGYSQAEAQGRIRAAEAGVTPPPAHGVDKPSTHGHKRPKAA